MPKQSDSIYQINASLSQEKHYERGIWVILLLAGTLFRLPHLTQCSLWLDETWRLALAEAPLRSVREDPFALYDQLASYHGLLRLIINVFGVSEWSIRIMSALAGAVAVPVTYQLGRKVLSREAAILAALLLCLNPLHITYSQEAAAYAIGSFLVPIFLMAGMRLVVEARSGTLLVTIITGALLGIAFIYLLVFVLVVLSLYFFLAPTPRTRFSFSVAAGGVIFLCLPILFHYIIRQIGGEGPPPTDISYLVRSFAVRLLNSLVSGPLNVVHGIVFRADDYVPSLAPGANVFARAVGWFGLGALISVIPVCAFIQAKRIRDLGLWLLATSFYVLFLILQSIVTHQAQVRYLVPVLPVLLIFFASIASFPERFVRFFGRLVVGCMLVNFLIVIWRDPPGKKWKPDARSVAAQIVRAGTGCAEVVVIVPELFEVPLYEFYLGNSNCQILYQPAFEQYFHQSRRGIGGRTFNQLKQETEWFVRSLREKKAASVIYIISQRDKQRADEIADLLKAEWIPADRSDTDEILVLKLLKTKP